ncbi:hypothetical protein QOL99_15560, partial [Deinococcus sp. MIMF12]
MRGGIEGQAPLPPRPDRRDRGAGGRQAGAAGGVAGGAGFRGQNPQAAVQCLHVREVGGVGTVQHRLLREFGPVVVLAGVVQPHGGAGAAR